MDLGFGLPSLPLDLPQEQKDRVLTGRDSLGKKYEVSALYEEGVRCRRWPRGCCQGQHRMEGCGTPLQEHPISDPSAKALERLLSLTSKAFLYVSYKVASQQKDTSPASH